MKKSALILAVAAMFTAACTSETSTQSSIKEPAPAAMADVRTKAVLVYADWCGSCKILDPKLKAVRAANSFDGVEFVVLDYTDKNADAFYKAAADAGVETAVRDAQAGTIKTGILLLVDADDNKVIGKVTKALDESEIVSEINSALARS